MAKAVKNDPLKVSPELRRRQKETITSWLDELKLVGDVKGFIYYISYEHIDELFRRLYGRAK